MTPHSPLQGLSIAVLGPTFPTLAANVGKNVSDIYYIFVGRSLGSLGGSVVGGVLLDCMNPSLLLGECAPPDGGVALSDTVRGNFCFSAASAAPEGDAVPSPGSGRVRGMCCCSPRCPRLPPCRPVWLVAPRVPGTAALQREPGPAGHGRSGNWD